MPPPPSNALRTSPAFCVRQMDTSPHSAIPGPVPPVRDCSVPCSSILSLYNLTELSASFVNVLKKTGLIELLVGSFAPRQLANLRPGCHQPIVGQRFLRPSFALTHAIEAIGQITRHLSLLPSGA